MKRWYVDHIHSCVPGRTWFGELFVNNRVAHGLRLVTALGSLDHWEAIQCAEYVGRTPAKPGYTKFSAHLRTEQHMDHDGYRAWHRRNCRRLPEDELRRKRHDFVTIDARPAFEIFHGFHQLSARLAPRTILGGLSGHELEAARGTLERYAEAVELDVDCPLRKSYSPRQLEVRIRDLVVEASDAWMQFLGDEIARRKAA